jgi:hypothetical protein
VPTFVGMRTIPPALALLLALSCARRADDAEVAPAHEPTAQAPEPPDQDAVTRLAIHDVDFRVGPGVLRVRRLDGTLVAPEGSRPRLDAPDSYTIAVSGAEIAVSEDSLTAMLGDGALEDAVVRTEPHRIVLRGTLRDPVRLTFEMRARVEASADGRLLVVPTTLKAGGVPTRGLMKAFDVRLEDVFQPKEGGALEVRGDRLLIDPLGGLKAPRVDGKVSAVRVDESGLVLTLGDPPDRDPDAPNGLRIHEGTVDSGKMTMHDVDLHLIDLTPEDPLDLHLKDFQKQVLQGYSKPQRDGGVKVYLPDYEDLE